MAERVGFIGLGIMGSRMAANLCRGGYEVTVWNRTTATAKAWAQERGATVARDPAEVAAASDVLITVVVDGSQVHDVLLGANGAVHGARPGMLCIDMSTIGPDATRKIGAELSGHEIAFLDAPVTGSSPKAQDGTLTIMVGGSDKDLKRARPLLEVMGTRLFHCGPLGYGQAMKVLSNAVAATNAVVLAQALLVGRAADLNIDALAEVICAGSGGSVIATLKAKPMIDHDYTTFFKLHHMLKDVDLALDVAAEAQIEFPAAGNTRSLLDAAAGLGFGDADFIAVIEALEKQLARRL
ncbi:MAG: NAD(P)-dependent oxidoreductase [Solirubrobacterales bacterium]|nr:NAD(P)-dependent oxidoreductase [Solirubrobacterales bacterium]